MMELTKEEAIRLHRELWDWLSKNPKKEKWEWPGWENFDEHWTRRNMFCFACAGSDCCDACLIDWPGVDCCNAEEDDDKGLFSLWDRCKNNSERTRLAEQIRDLPVRSGDYDK